MRTWFSFPLPRSARGMTFIETIVYLVVFSLFLVMAMGVFTWYRNSQQGTQRLDVLHQLRLGMALLSEDLSYGSGILYPPESGVEAPSSHQLSYRNAVNELILVFRNNRQELMRANLTQKALGKPYLQTLARSVTRFQVKRPGTWYVEYELSGKQEVPPGQGPEMPEYHLIESTRIRNVIK